MKISVIEAQLTLLEERLSIAMKHKDKCVPIILQEIITLEDELEKMKEDDEV